MQVTDFSIIDANASRTVPDSDDGSDSHSGSEDALAVYPSRCPPSPAPPPLPSLLDPRLVAPMPHP